MIRYKDYKISTTAMHATGLAVSGAIYVVRMDEMVVRTGTVHGPFNCVVDAHSAAGSAAHGWIDQQGK